MVKAEMSRAAVETGQRISFHFRAEGVDGRPLAVEKADANGDRRRYVSGVSSGLKVDAHGERMTEKAIQSFMEQASSQDILLYADLHGIRSTQDIGILVKAEVLENGDWWTEYRLYDEMDGVDTASTETADKLWRQLNGLPPYSKPAQKGFSIEGNIPPETGTVEMRSGRKAINDVRLDGVVVVPRPAYEDSVANAVYKALGETAPWVGRQTVAGMVQRQIRDEEDREDFFRQRYMIEDATKTLVDRAMEDDAVEDKAEAVAAILHEQADLLADLYVRHAGAAADQGSSAAKSESSQDPVVNMWKALLASLEDLEALREDMMDGKVSKALSATAQGIVANIRSLLEQLEQAEGQGSTGASGQRAQKAKAPGTRKQSTRKGAKTMKMDATQLQEILNSDISDETKNLIVAELTGTGGAPEMEEPDVEMAEDFQEEDQETMKATGSDSAEDVVGDNQEVSTEDAVADEGDNLKQIVKAVGKQVNKSLAPIVKQQSEQAEAISQLAGAVTNILEGIGLTKDIMGGDQDKPQEPVHKSTDRPLTMSDLRNMGELFGGLSVRKSDDEGIGLVEPFSVRKSGGTDGGLKELLTGIAGNGANGRV